MTLLALPNLYATPSQVMDYLGSEGTQLRLDDHNQATGQIIIVTVAAPLGATTLNVGALSLPLIAGTVLEFDGGNLPAVVEVVLSVTAPLGATSLTVVPLSAAVNAQAQATDNGVNLALAQRLVRACQIATSQVKDYCCGRYNDSDLAVATTANRWAMALAARWLCRRRGNVAPKSVEEDAKEALEEMRRVQVGQMNIADIGTRTAGWPFLSNVNVNPAYEYARVRVEPSISEGTPTQYGQFIDWNSIFAIEQF